MPVVRRPYPLLPLLLLCAVLAPPAQAVTPVGPAELSLDARCYAQGAPLRMTAAGLLPGAPLTVALDGRPLRYRDGSTPRADAAGSFASSFATPALAAGARQQRHRLAVSDGEQRARARFTVTRPAGADFAPAHGNPRTLRARFSVWGFALESGSNARVWLHWVDPAGAERSHAALGVTQGDCGTLTTAPRRVFPFDAEPGEWTLVIDGHRRYRVQPDGARAKIPVHVRPLSL